MKRIIDLVLLLAVAPLALPLCATVAVLVRIKLGSPVLFRQHRIGRGDRVFRLIKFRTMTDARDQRGVLLPDCDRLPAFGRFLRSSSLDELPELWNVLRGEMSFVGPRPLLVHYLPLYSPEQRRRHAVRPGITGFAQVEGRNRLSWADKFAADVWYVDHQSIWLDFRILWRTAGIVLKREGISAVGEATMAPFRGDES